MPLAPGNNLSELTDDLAARSNLGLGTIATHPASDYVPLSLFTSPNELLISTGAGAVTRVAPPPLPGSILGYSGGVVTWEPGASTFLVKASNLADVPDKAAARDNLGVPDLSEIILKSIINAAGDLLVGTADDAVGRLGAGGAGSNLSIQSGVPVWRAPSGFHAIAASDLGVAGSATQPLLGWTPLTNSGGHFDSTNAVYTAPENGMYQFTFAGYWLVDAGGAGAFQIQFRQYRAAALMSNYGCANDSLRSTTHTIMVPLAAGDVIQLWIANAATTACRFLRLAGNGAYLTYWSGSRLFAQA